MRAVPVITASPASVLPRAAFSRSVYFLVSLKVSGSFERRVVSRSSNEPSSATRATRSRAEMRNG